MWASNIIENFMVLQLKTSKENIKRVNINKMKGKAT